MKIFTNENIQAIERMTCESQKVGDLIPRMAEAVVGEIVRRWRPTKHTVIFAGPGNNGADALEVSRLLLEHGYNPEVYLFNIGGKRLNTACQNFRDALLKEFPNAQLTEVVSSFSMPDITQQTLVIDGLFGSGLRAPLEGGFQAVARYINESKATVVAIDIPSGLFPDWNPHTIGRNIIHADLTLTPQLPHLSFFFAENDEYIGEWRLLDIGLSQEAINATPTQYHFVEAQEVQPLLRRRPEHCSKADFGHAMIIAGSRGMMGAASFAALGALRAGVGKLTLRVPQCGLDIMQTLVPEAMCDVDVSPNGSNMLTDFMPAHNYDAIGIGPGIGKANCTISALEKLLKNTSKPVVIDADALNCIADSPNLINHIPKLSIITPHAGEFDRLFGQHTGDEARLHKAVEISKRHNILIVLKGRYTALVRPDGKIYFNSSGTPALATAGAGDVLTGVITALMAQGYKPEVSALIGVFIHGRAGEIAAATHGQYGVLARDIASAVSQAIKELMKL